MNKNASKTTSKAANKPLDATIVTIRINDKVLEWVDMLAAEENRSRANMIETLLIQARLRHAQSLGASAAQNATRQGVSDADMPLPMRAHK